MYVGDPRAFKCLYSKIQAWLVSMRSTAIRTQAQQRIQPIQPVPLEILIANTASEKTLALFCQVLRRVTHDLTAAFLQIISYHDHFSSINVVITAVNSEVVF